jgi:hypothetical protein
VPAFERGEVPNANANTANAVMKSFFPMMCPLTVWAIEPGDDCEVAKENARTLLATDEHGFARLLIL